MAANHPTAPVFGIALPRVRGVYGSNSFSQKQTLGVGANQGPRRGGARGHPPPPPLPPNRKNA